MRKEDQVGAEVIPSRDEMKEEVAALRRDLAKIRDGSTRFKQTSRLWKKNTGSIKPDLEEEQRRVVGIRNKRD